MRTGCHYLISPSACVFVCVAFVVFTDCESCTWLISTNSGSMEAGECELTRGTCFITCRLDVLAVAGLLWITWFVFGGVDFFSCFSFFRSFFLGTHTACCQYEAAFCLIYLSTSNEARPKERSDRGRFLPLRQKSLFIMRQGRGSEAT